jgi:hypothetical protein
MEEIRKRIESFSPPRTSPASQSLPITEEFNTGSVGTNFMPHIIDVKAGKNVTMQPDFSRGISRPDGRVVGGGVAGILVAASPMQFGVNSRVLPSTQLEPKPKKLKNGSGRPRESLSLYQEGAENIKGVLHQIVKQNEKEKGEHGVIFAWFRKRKKNKKEEVEEEVGILSLDQLFHMELKLLLIMYTRRASSLEFILMLGFLHVKGDQDRFFMKIMMQNSLLLGV